MTRHAITRYYQDASLHKEWVRTRARAAYRNMRRNGPEQAPVWRELFVSRSEELLRLRSAAEAHRNGRGVI